MRPSSSILSLAVPLLVSAAPTSFRRANDADVTVLQFAGVLEDLESQFYSQALSTFQASDFTAAGFTDPNIPIQQFTAIGSDESTHLTTIQDTLQSLGAEAISGCSFNFSSALTSVAAMAPVARTVENVGVAAYLGAAHLITDPSVLTAAASIMTIEARHQTILNLVNNATSIPQAFDLAFTPGEVLAVAGSFISGCSTGITANTALTVTNNGSIAPGTTLTFSSSALNGNQANIAARYYVGEDAWDEKSASSDSTSKSSKSSSSSKDKNKNKNESSSNSNTSSSNSTSTSNSTTSSNSTCTSTSQLFCQIMVGGSSSAMALSIDSCQIPDGLNGPAAVFITCDDSTLPTDVVQRASSQSILAGPAMIFVDTEVDLLAGLSKTGASCETDSITNSTTTTAAASTSTATDSTATASTDTATAASTAAASSAATDSTAAAATSTTSTAAAATSTDSTAATTTSVDSTTAAATAVTTTINSSMALSIISAAGASATTATTATAAADAAVANIMYGSVPARR